MSTDPNEPATACPPVYSPDGCGIAQGSYGLSKREYFAALALQGLLACPESPNPAGGQSWAQSMGKHAVAYADGLIAALNAEPAP